MARQHRSPHTSPAFSQPLTSAEKSRATRLARREAQHLQDEADALAASRMPPRSAKLKAQQRSVWINNDAVQRRRPRTATGPKGKAVKKPPKHLKPRAPDHPDEYDDIEDDDINDNDDDDDVPLSLSQAAKASKRAPKEVTPDVDDIEEADKRENEQRGSSETDFVEEDEFEEDEDEDDIVMDEELRWSSAPAKSEDRDRDSGDDEVDEDIEGSDRDEGDGDDREVREAGEETEDIKDDEAGEDQEAVEDGGGNEDDDNSSDSEDSASDSDSDLEYAGKHGISGLLKKRERQVARKLFGNDQDVVDARAKKTIVPRASHSKPSRQATRLHAEMPRWNSHRRASQPTTTTGRHARRDHPSKPRWDPVTRFKLTRRGTLALNQSHPALKTYFNDVELSMKLHVIRNNAFPGEKSTLWYSLFRKANGTGDHSEGFYPRILQDKPFRMALFEAMSTRLSQFRGKFKTAAASKLSASYHLGNPSAQSIRKVDELLYHKRYIYPGEILDRDTFYPEIAYKHPIFADVIKEVLMPRRKCFIIKYARSFKVTWEGAVRFELPRAVVALAAAAVEAALVDFKNGSFRASDFLADSFDSVYTAHIDILGQLSHLQPLAYHNLMVELFDNTIGCNKFMPDSADAKGVLADVGLRREDSVEI